MEQQSTSLKLSQNSFDYFRLFAAFQVMFGHMVSLYEIKLPFYIPLRFIGGVPILFTLCGFLVTASYAKSKNVGEYFKKRFFRIFPPLWFSVWIGFVILLLFSNGEFPVGKAAVWTFLQGFALQYTPGFAKEFGSGTFNGALWALFTEMQFYLLVPLFYRFMKNRKIKSWLVIGIVLIAVQIGGTELAAASHSRGLILLWKRGILAQSSFFYIGCFLYVFKDTVLNRLIKYAPWLFVGYTFLYILWNIFDIGILQMLATDCLLPILILTLGYFLGQHRLRYDISYGIYLYHVMIINIFLELQLALNIGTILLIVMLSCGCGVISLLIDKGFRKILP